MALIKIHVRPARWLASCATAVIVSGPLLSGVAAAADTPGGGPDLPLAPGGNGPEPDISVDDVTAAEGSGGPSGFHFTVSLSSPSDVQVTAQVMAVDGTATDPGDWQGVASALVFAPGETAKEYVVSVVGDHEPEDDEVFAVMVEDIEHAGIGDVEGLGTILDDDAAGGEGGIGDDGDGGEPDDGGTGGGGPSPTLDDAPLDGAALDEPVAADGAGRATRPTMGDDADEPSAPPSAATGGGEALPLALAGVGAGGAGVVALVMARRRRQQDG